MTSAPSQACETCRRNVVLEGPAGRAVSRVYWCPRCSIDHTMAVRIRLPNGALSLGVMDPSDGQAMRFHPLSEVQIRKTTVVGN